MTTTSSLSKPDCFIFDIDGTLADHDGIRSPFDETKVLYDKPIPSTFKVLEALYTSGYEIIFVSGRSNACRHTTIEWIQTNCPVLKISDIELYMRVVNDRRSDDIVKSEIYDLMILPHFNIVGVFDDRLRVCRMLYDKGIFVFNVNQGLKEF